MSKPIPISEYGIARTQTLSYLGILIRIGLGMLIEKVHRRLLLCE